jgi:endonuclease YncB( thermonuclease family)
MTSPASPAFVVPKTYAELRRRVEAVLLTGRRQVEEAWVSTYHETGRLIHEHVLLKEKRADYGAQVYAQLSVDVGVSGRTLRECVQFYRCFPIWRPVAKFGWNQCRLLCQVGDEARRQALVTEMTQGRLPTVDLKARVRAFNAAARRADEEDDSAVKPPPARLVRRRGTPGLFRVVSRDGALAVDVGFKLYLALTPAQSRGLEAGAIVRIADGEIAPAPDATADDLFTYRASVRRVIDGDTLAVTIALPHYAMDEKLRLRRIDCPEIDTAEGRAAKRYVEALLADATEVTITTSKVDKYDRYLADVHVRRSNGEEVFLNNALLKDGHAVPMGAEAMMEWAP